MRTISAAGIDVVTELRPEAPPLPGLFVSDSPPQATSDPARIAPRVIRINDRRLGTCARFMTTPFGLERAREVRLGSPLRR